MSVSPQDLRSIFLFSKFDDADLAEVCQAICARDYPPRAIVFAQGEPSPGLWFVRRGRMRLYRSGDTGRELTLCLARCDSLPCLGGCPLIDGDVAPVTAQALEPTTLYFLERQRALDIAARNVAMAHLVSRVLANHSRRLARLSSDLAFRCSIPRLVDLLLTYARDRGRPTARGIELDLDITRELLASVLGTTSQMIAQDFLRLEREGLVDARGKHIVLLSPARLTQMS